MGGGLTSMIVLSYHKFVDTPSDYRFSRTYEQFEHDIRKKEYDLITIDDAMECMPKACEILKKWGVHAKLFVPTELVGTKGYCTWSQLKELATFHHIENHGSNHKDHTKLTAFQIGQSIGRAQHAITNRIGIAPKYFVGPYNQYDDRVERIAATYNLTCLKDRINITNYYK